MTGLLGCETVLSTILVQITYYIEVCQTYLFIAVLGIVHIYEPLAYCTVLGTILIVRGLKF